MKLEDITLDWLQARVREDEDGCWIWTGCYGRGGEDPQATVDYKVWPVRRLIWTLVHCKPVPKGQRVGSSCSNPACCHPEHVQARKTGSALRGRKLPIATRIRIANTRRASSALTQEAVQQIRLDDRPAEVLAQEHQIDPSYVYYIRAGKIRRDYSNPFAGLGA